MTGSGTTFGDRRRAGIPDIQQASLRTLGRWMARLGDVITAAQPVPQTVAQPTDDPWVRWLGTPAHLVAVVEQVGEIMIVTRRGQKPKAGTPALPSPLALPDARPLGARDG
jgi:hypothetical protein